MLKLTLNKGGKTLQVRFGYNPALVSQIKETGAAKWNDGQKYWALRPTESGLNWLLKHDWDVTDSKTSNKLCEWLEKLEIKQKNRPHRIRLANATEAPIIQHVLDQCHFVNSDGEPCQPRAYQWVPCHYARLNGGNMLLLDAMGVGKTTQSIMVSLQKEYEKAPVLIVCPPSLVGNWEAELQKMFRLPSKIINKPLTKLDPNIRFYIVSYYQMKKIQVKAGWFLIVDEVHNFKNKDTVRYKELERFLDQKKFLMGMTGTPVPNRPKELFPAMNAVEPGFYNWFDFAVLFCDGKYNGFGWDFNGASNLDVLHDWLYNDFAVRREKEQVLGQLPEKIRQVVSWEEDKEVAADTVLGVFAESCRQKVKVKEFWEALDDTMTSLDKVIVFAHHKEMLHAIEERCKKLGLKYIYIDGTVDGGKRYGLIQQFQTDPEVRVAILSITAAGEGLNITAAQAVVFAELYWVPAKIKQAEDRAHRPGVKHSVLCLYLLWGKREQEIHKMIMKKDGIPEKVLAGKHLDVSEEDMMQALAKQWGVSPALSTRRVS